MSFLLTKVVSSLLKKVFEESFRIDAADFQGKLHLRHLTVRKDVLDQLGLPIEIVEGIAEDVHIKLPWRDWTFAPLSHKKRDFGASVEVIVSGLRVAIKPLVVAREAASTEDQVKAKVAATEKEVRDAISLKMVQWGVGGEDEESLFGTLLEQVKKFIKIEIKRIHVQYEDAVTNPGRPLTMGLLLEKVSLAPCENGACCKRGTGPEADGLEGNTAPRFRHHIVRIDGLSVYLNEGTMDDLKLKPSASQKLVVASRWTGLDVSKLQLLMAPVGATVSVTENEGRVNTATDPPQRVMAIAVSRLDLGIQEKQIRLLHSIVSYVDQYDRRQRYKHIRRGKTPRERWRFAFAAVVSDLRAVRNSQLTVFQASRRELLRKSYIASYKSLMRSRKEKLLIPPTFLPPFSVVSVTSPGDRGGGEDESGTVVTHLYDVEGQSRPAKLMVVDWGAPAANITVVSKAMELVHRLVSVRELVLYQRLARAELVAEKQLQLQREVQLDTIHKIAKGGGSSGSTWLKFRSRISASALAAVPLAAAAFTKSGLVPTATLTEAAAAKKSRALDSASWLSKLLAHEACTTNELLKERLKHYFLRARVEHLVKSGSAVLEEGSTTAVANFRASLTLTSFEKDQLYSAMRNDVVLPHGYVRAMTQFHCSQLRLAVRKSVTRHKVLQITGRDVNGSIAKRVPKITDVSLNVAQLSVRHFLAPFREEDRTLHRRLSRVVSFKPRPLRLPSFQMPSWNCAPPEDWLTLGRKFEGVPSLAQLLRDDPLVTILLDELRSMPPVMGPRADDLIMFWRAAEAFRFMPYVSRVKAFPFMYEHFFRSHDDAGSPVADGGTPVAGAGAGAPSGVASARAVLASRARDELRRIDREFAQAQPEATQESFLPSNMFVVAQEVVEDVLREGAVGRFVERHWCPLHRTLNQVCLSLRQVCKAANALRSEVGIHAPKATLPSFVAFADDTSGSELEDHGDGDSDSLPQCLVVRVRKRKPTDGVTVDDSDSDGSMFESTSDDSDTESGKEDDTGPDEGLVNTPGGAVPRLAAVTPNERSALRSLKRKFERMKLSRSRRSAEAGDSKSSPSRWLRRRQPPAQADPPPPPPLATSKSLARDDEDILRSIMRADLEAPLPAAHQVSPGPKPSPGAAATPEPSPAADVVGVIKQGYLHKLDADGKRWTRMYFLLNSDNVSLFYFRSRTDRSDPRHISIKSSLQVLPGTSVAREELPLVSNRRFELFEAQGLCLTLEAPMALADGTPAAAAVLYAVAPTPADRDDWLGVLGHAVAANQALDSTASPASMLSPRVRARTLQDAKQLLASASLSAAASTRSFYGGMSAAAGEEDPQRAQKAVLVVQAAVAPCFVLIDPELVVRAHRFAARARSTLLINPGPSHLDLVRMVVEKQYLANEEFAEGPLGRRGHATAGMSPAEHALLQAERAMPALHLNVHCHRLTAVAPLLEVVEPDAMLGTPTPMPGGLRRRSWVPTPPGSPVVPGQGRAVSRPAAVAAQATAGSRRSPVIEKVRRAVRKALMRKRGEHFLHVAFRQTDGSSAPECRVRPRSMMAPTSTAASGLAPDATPSTVSAAAAAADDAPPSVVLFDLTVDNLRVASITTQQATRLPNQPPTSPPLNALKIPAARSLLFDAVEAKFDSLSVRMYEVSSQSMRRDDSRFVPLHTHCVEAKEEWAERLFVQWTAHPLSVRGLGVHVLKCRVKAHPTLPTNAVAAQLPSANAMFGVGFVQPMMGMVLAWEEAVRCLSAAADTEPDGSEEGEAADVRPLDVEDIEERKVEPVAGSPRRPPAAPRPPPRRPSRPPLRLFRGSALQTTAVLDVTMVRFSLLGPGQAGVKCGSQMEGVYHIKPELVARGAGAFGGSSPASMERPPEVGDPNVTWLSPVECFNEFAMLTFTKLHGTLAKTSGRTGAKLVLGALTLLDIDRLVVSRLRGLYPVFPGATSLRDAITGAATLEAKPVFTIMHSEHSASVQAADDMRSALQTSRRRRLEVKPGAVVTLTLTDPQALAYNAPRVKVAAHMDALFVVLPLSFAHMVEYAAKGIVNMSELEAKRARELFSHRTAAEKSRSFRAAERKQRLKSIATQLADGGQVSGNSVDAERLMEFTRESAAVKVDLRTPSAGSTTTASSRRRSQDLWHALKSKVTPQSKMRSAWGAVLGENDTDPTSPVAVHTSGNGTPVANFLRLMHANEGAGGHPATAPNQVTLEVVASLGSVAAALESEEEQHLLFQSGAVKVFMSKEEEEAKPASVSTASSDRVALAHSVMFVTADKGEVTLLRGCPPPEADVCLPLGGDALSDHFTLVYCFNQSRWVPDGAYWSTHAHGVAQATVNNLVAMVKSSDVMAVKHDVTLGWAGLEVRAEQDPSSLPPAVVRWAFKSYKADTTHAVDPFHAHRGLEGNTVRTLLALDKIKAAPTIRVKVWNQDLDIHPGDEDLLVDVDVGGLRAELDPLAVCMVVACVDAITAADKVARAELEALNKAVLRTLPLDVNERATMKAALAGQLPSGDGGDFGGPSFRDLDEDTPSKTELRMAVSEAVLRLYTMANGTAPPPSAAPAVGGSHHRRSMSMTDHGVAEAVSTLAARRLLPAVVEFAEIAATDLSLEVDIIPVPAKGGADKDVVLKSRAVFLTDLSPPDPAARELLPAGLDGTDLDTVLQFKPNALVLYPLVMPPRSRTRELYRMEHSRTAQYRRAFHRLGQQRFRSQSGLPPMRPAPDTHSVASSSEEEEDEADVHVVTTEDVPSPADTASPPQSTRHRRSVSGSTAGTDAADGSDASDTERSAAAKGLRWRRDSAGLGAGQPASATPRRPPQAGGGDAAPRRSADRSTLQVSVRLFATPAPTPEQKRAKKERNLQYERRQLDAVRDEVSIPLPDRQVEAVQTDPDTAVDIHIARFGFVFVKRYVDELKATVDVLKASIDGYNVWTASHVLRQKALLFDSIKVMGESMKLVIPPALHTADHQVVALLKHLVVSNMLTGYPFPGGATAAATNRPIAMERFTVGASGASAWLYTAGAAPAPLLNGPEQLQVVFDQPLNLSEKCVAGVHMQVKVMAGGGSVLGISERQLDALGPLLKSNTKERSSLVHLPPKLAADTNMAFQVVVPQLQVMLSEPLVAGATVTLEDRAASEDAQDVASVVASPPAVLQGPPTPSKVSPPPGARHRRSATMGSDAREWGASFYGRVAHNGATRRRNSFVAGRRVAVEDVPAKPAEVEGATVGGVPTVEEVAEDAASSEPPSRAGSDAESDPKRHRKPPLGGGRAPPPPPVATPAVPAYAAGRVSDDDRHSTGTEDASVLESVDGRVLEPHLLAVLGLGGVPPNARHTPSVRGVLDASAATLRRLSAQTGGEGGPPEALARENARLRAMVDAMARSSRVLADAVAAASDRAAELATQRRLEIQLLSDNNEALTQLLVTTQQQEIDATAARVHVLRHPAASSPPSEVPSPAVSPNRR